MALKPERLRYFENLLYEEKARLESVSADHRKHNLTIDPADLTDEADMATSQINQNLVFRIRDRERILLQKIHKALDKVREGTFGECESCSDDIEEKRLEARLVATLCIKCKEDQEHKESVTV